MSLIQRRMIEWEDWLLVHTAQYGVHPLKLHNIATTGHIIAKKQVLKEGKLKKRRMQNWRFTLHKTELLADHQSVSETVNTPWNALADLRPGLSGDPEHS